LTATLKRKDVVEFIKGRCKE